MKTYKRTIMLFVVAGAIIAASAMAQSLPAVQDAETSEIQKTQEDAAQREAELATRLTQRQAEIAQKQAEVMQKQVELAAAAAPTRPVVPVAPAPVTPLPPSTGRLDEISTMLKGLSLPSQRQAGGTAVLVIPSAEMTTQEFVSVTEDLNVMSRIFEDNLEKARISPVGTSLFLSEDRVFGRFMGAERDAIQSMYLQGYGILFLMKVDFPLSSPPEAKEEEKAEEQKEEKSDPVWDKTRQQLYEPQKASRDKSDKPEEKYDAEKVENLKNTLIQALKHAANIRSLKPDELVIITVAGTGGSAGSNAPMVAISGKNIIVTERHDGGTATTKLIQGSSPDEVGLFSSAILVIRAKKSDIDSFAKGDLDTEKFGQRVQMLTCPYMGARTGYGDGHPFNYYGHR